jgi:hypothetical protein
MEELIGPSRILWREAATPLTQEHYTCSTGGACYGLELATDQFGPRRPGPRTSIRGLYLAGASTVWGHGVVGVMTGGLGAASAVLGRDLRRELRDGTVLRPLLPARDDDPLLTCKRLSVKPAAARARARDLAAPPAGSSP